MQPISCPVYVIHPVCPFWSFHMYNIAKAVYDDVVVYDIFQWSSGLELRTTRRVRAKALTQTRVPVVWRYVPILYLVRVRLRSVYYSTQ